MEVKKNTREIDMLTGSLADKLILFAWPLALTGIFQQMYSAADLLVLGQFVGKNAMAAVGNNAAVIGLFVNLFLGIALGANVVIARYIGAKREQNILVAVHTAFILAIIAGIFLLVLGEIFMDSLVSLMAVPKEVEHMASEYLRVYILAMPAISLYNFEAAIFRSRGDTKTPLIGLFIATFVNLCLNLIFVLLFHMSVAGVAFASVLANCVCASILFLKLYQSEGKIRIIPNRLKEDFRIVDAIEMLRIGIPAGLQGVVFCVSNLIIQVAINSLGPEAMAACSVCFIIEVMVYSVVMGFGQGATTFVSQNYGAGNLKRCKEIVRVCLLWGSSSMLAVSLVITFFGEEVMRFFNDDPKVIALGVIRILYVVAPEVINGMMEIYTGALRGYGFSMPPAILTLVSICGIRIIWVYTIFEMYPTFTMLMIVYPISWVVSTLLMAVVYKFYTRNIKEFKFHDDDKNLAT